MSREQIDPQLPYVQVHRSSALAAVGLAGLADVTPQHARGSILAFWEGLSDRRILRAALERPDGPAVVLTEEEAADRLMMAFGKSMSPRLVAVAGFLEPLPGGGYRVRGMSRQMSTEAKRLRASGWRPPGEPHLSPTSAPPQPRLSTPSGGGPAGVEPGRGERREERGESLKEVVVEKAAPMPVEAFALEAPTTSPEVWDSRDFWRWAECRRRAGGYPPERWPNTVKLSRWWSEARGVVPDVQTLKKTFYAFGQDKHWETAKPPYPFGGFMSQWNQYLPAKEAS